MTHKIPAGLRKQFSYSGAYSHKRTRKVKEGRQHRLFHTKSPRACSKCKEGIPHEHRYVNKKTGIVRWEEYP